MFNMAHYTTDELLRIAKAPGTEEPVRLEIEEEVFKRRAEALKAAAQAKAPAQRKRGVH